MSLLPLVYSHNWDHHMRPSRILDQHFGVALDTSDLLSPLIHPLNSLSLIKHHPGYHRPWRPCRKDSGSTLKIGKDKYVVTLDVQQFTPEEITVKATGNNTIIVEGKHEEKPDEHGFISRHFVRKYILPDGHDINNVVSTLSSDGVLSITAPRVGGSGEDHRFITIQQTGTPMRVIEKKGEQPEKEEQATQHE